MYDILELSKKLLPELKDIAKGLKINKAESLKKQDLIYKIIDQQAIEATASTTVTKSENEDIVSSYEENVALVEEKVSATEENVLSAEEKNTESDSSLRRGKRPRTLKPIVKRGVESVMSVSPDDLLKPETRTSERYEQVKVTVKT